LNDQIYKFWPNGKLKLINRNRIKLLASQIVSSSVHIFKYIIMKKIALALSLIILATVAFSQKSFYDFKVKDIEGKDFDLSSLRGKKVLVVNTASKCGNTPQYADLEKLYNEYKGQDFVIIGFPANNFGSQEPGTNDEIAEFCEKNYGVTFKMMSKISVKGDDIHPLYKWLTSKSENGVLDSEVKWNFQKYLIDENGKLVGTVDPKVKPYDEKILSWITK
jgi:glutathione peroxidase